MSVVEFFRRVFSKSRVVRNASHIQNLRQQLLNQELLTILGQYQPGQMPVIYNPIQTGNLYSLSTLVHEKTHQTLTINTTYGLFYQALVKAAGRGQRLEELSCCLEHQWGVQEATATYVQLVQVAIDQPSDFNRAVSLLPSTTVGQPPYREWYELLSGLLPIEPFSGQKPVARRLLEARAHLAMAIAVYALNTDILTVFREPDSLTPNALRQYLETHSPDQRFADMIQRIEQEQVLPSLLSQAQRVELYNNDSHHRAEENSTVSEAISRFSSIVSSITNLDSNGQFIDNNALSKQQRAFSEQWSVRYVVITGPDQEPIPAVFYIQDWIRRFPNAFPESTLTLTSFREQLELAKQANCGLACAITMAHKKEVHLATLPYPTDQGVNPISWDAVVQLLEHPPTREGVFRTEEILRLFEDFPGLELAVQFVRGSWRLWDQVAQGRHVLREGVQVCVQVNLSEKYLRELLDFRYLGKTAQYFVFQVFGEQFAVCFADYRRPGIYALQGIPGEAGLEVFSTLAERLGLEPIAGSCEELPHWLLIRFLAQGLLI